MRSRYQDTLESIHNYLAAEMLDYHRLLKNTLAEQAVYLHPNELSLYKNGKNLRPIFLLLAAKLTNNELKLPDKAIDAGVSLEMLHVASLIHDDIIDDDNIRRGKPAIHVQQGIARAILIGDLQLVYAMSGFASAIEEMSDVNLVKQLLHNAKHITFGALDELTLPDTMDTGVLEKYYFKLADRKTALLFGMACETGAALVNAPTSTVINLGIFGRKYGQSFQIIDDIDAFLELSNGNEFDYADLKQKRLSLPIIYALDGLADDHILVQVFKSESVSKDMLIKAHEYVRNSNGIVKASLKAREFMQEAMDNLAQIPGNTAKDLLQKLGFDTIARLTSSHPLEHQVLMSKNENILQLFVNILYKQLNNTNSKYYLPKLLSQQTQPALEPYQIRDNWQIPNIKHQQGATMQICTANVPGDGIATANGTSLVLSSISINGISNSKIVAQPTITKENGIDVLTLKLAANKALLKGNVDGIVVNGKFKIAQACTNIADSIPFMVDGFGTFHMHFSQSEFAIKASILANADNLIIEIQDISTVIDDTNVNIKVDITDDTNKVSREIWNSEANLVFQSADAIDALLNNIRSSINTNTTKNILSQLLTKQLNRVFNS